MFENLLSFTRMHVIMFIKDKARPLALSFGFYRPLVGPTSLSRDLRERHTCVTLPVNIPFNIQPFLEGSRE